MKLVIYRAFLTLMLCFILIHQPIPGLADLPKPETVHQSNSAAKNCIKINQAQTCHCHYAFERREKSITA